MISSADMYYTYDLSDIGRYYRDYVELMAHFDHVLPGRVHRVFYEDMVRDPETEIRRLLDYCGVPFEASCLRFHETARGVRTASSEQVRRPIYAEAVGHWRNYEPWLGPLKSALGPCSIFIPPRRRSEHEQPATSRATAGRHAIGRVGSRGGTSPDGSCPG